jgi:hypothetical protein
VKPGFLTRAMPESTLFIVHFTRPSQSNYTLLDRKLLLKRFSTSAGVSCPEVLIHNLETIMLLLPTTGLAAI